MPAKRQRFQKDEPRSLRERSDGQEFTAEQSTYLGSFIAAMLMGGNAVYAVGNASGNSIRMTLYVEGEKWADNLVPSDDFAVVLGDFAKQFGVDMFYLDCVKLLHAGLSGRRAERHSKPLARAAQAESTAE